LRKGSNKRLSTILNNQVKNQMVIIKGNIVATPAKKFFLIFLKNISR
jgi:hypothetical protein